MLNIEQQAIAEHQRGCVVGLLADDRYHGHNIQILIEALYDLGRMSGSTRWSPTRTGWPRPVWSRSSLDSRQWSCA